MSEMQGGEDQFSVDKMQVTQYRWHDIYERFHPLVSPFKWKIIFSMICVALAGIAVALMPLFPKYVIDTAIPAKNMVLALAAGALYFIPIAAQSTIMIETKQPFDPTILGGAASISSGIGQLLCVIVSFLFQGVAAASSMTVAYRVFFALCLIGLLGAILLRETGKKPEKTSV